MATKAQFAIRERAKRDGSTVGNTQRVACGIDVVDMDQFLRDLELGGAKFLARIYTEREIKLCGQRPESLAARFAAKEATLKALGTGLRGINWLEIEVSGNANGEPRLLLKGRASKRAKEMGLDCWSVSLSHSSHVAMAVVVAC